MRLSCYGTLQPHPHHGTLRHLALKNSCLCSTEVGLGYAACFDQGNVGKSASSKLWASQVLWVSACPSWAPVICPRDPPALQCGPRIKT